MQTAFNMSETSLERDAPPSGASRSGSIYDKGVVLLLLLLLARSGEALAAEQVSIVGADLKPELNGGAQPVRVPASLKAPMLSLSAAYGTELTPQDRFPSSEFRPRGHSVLEHESPEGSSADAPMLSDSTVWQRLADYRAHGRIRLLTLWESGASTLSLQAGKKGEPSLQWTSRLMNRGGATRGVLDQLVSESVARASHGLHMAPHPTNIEPTGRFGKLSEISAGANK